MKKILLLGKGYIGLNFYEYLKCKSDIQVQIFSQKNLNYLDLNILQEYLKVLLCTSYP